MKSLRPFFGVAIATVLAFSVTACAGGAAEPTGSEPETTAAPMTITVAATPNISLGALYLGIEEGFFEEEGLTVETSAVANPPASLAAAQSGQVEFAYSPSIPLLNALSQGVPLKVVAAADGFEAGASQSGEPELLDDTGLYAGPESGITSVKDLAGKTISVPARKAQLEVTIAALLEDAGVSAASVNWVTLDYMSAVSALKNGTIDAAGLVSPFNIEAAESGATLLASPAVSFFEEGAVGVWVAGSDLVEQDPEMVAAFQRAVAKANKFANENTAQAIESGLTAAGSDLTVDQVRPPFWPTTVTEKEIQRTNDKLMALGFLPSAVDLDGVITN